MSDNYFGKARVVGQGENLHAGRPDQTDERAALAGSLWSGSAVLAGAGPDGGAV